MTTLFWAAYLLISSYVAFVFLIITYRLLKDGDFSTSFFSWFLMFVCLGNAALAISKMIQS